MRIVLFSIVLLLCSCSTPRAEFQPKSIETPSAPNDSTLVIMWPTRRPTVQRAAVYIDGVERAILRRNRFVLLNTSSGTHDIKVKFSGALGIGMPSTEGTFSFTNGGKHFVVFSYDYDLQSLIVVGSAVVPMGTTTKSIIEVPPERGKQLIEPMSYGEVL